MDLSAADVIQFIALPLLGWLTWELRGLRKELGQTRTDMTDRIHFTECNRRMSELKNSQLDLASRAWDQEKRLSKLEGKEK